MSFCIGGYKRRRRLSGIASYFYLVFALEKLEREGLLHLVLLHFISKRGYLFFIFFFTFWDGTDWMIPRTGQISTATVAVQHET